MRRGIPPAVRWTLLALLGLLVAVAVGIAASELTSQRIGLSSEPIGAGDALAPERHERAPKPRGSDDGKQATTETTEAPPPTETTTETTSPDDSTEQEGPDDD